MRAPAPVICFKCGGDCRICTRTIDNSRVRRVRCKACFWERDAYTPEMDAAELYYTRVELRITALGR